MTVAPGDPTDTTAVTCDRRLLGYVTGMPRGCFAALDPDRFLLGLFCGPGAAVDAVILRRSPVSP